MTFFLSLLFVFMVFWRPQEWLLPWMFGWPILNVVFYVAVLAFIIEADAKQLRPKRTDPLPYFMVGLWIAACMSHIANTYFVGLMWTIWEVLKICLFTILLFYTIDRPSRIRQLAFVFVAVAIVMSVHALQQERIGYGFAGQRPLWVPARLDKPAHTRSMFFGIFSDPNDMSQFIVSSIPLVFAIPKRKHIILTVLCAGVEYYLYRGYETGHSRGASVAIAGVLGVWLILRFPLRWFPWLAAVGLVGAMAFLAAKGVSMLDMSARERVVFWGMGNQAFKAKPLFGIGYGMFPEITGIMAAHNAYVSCYTEMGLFGYWMWFSPIYLGGAATWRVMKQLKGNREPEALYLMRASESVLMSMGGFAASSYFLSRTFLYPFFILVAMLNAIPRAAEPYLKHGHEPLIDIRRDVLIMASLVTFGSIVYIYISILFLNRGYGG